MRRDVKNVFDYCATFHDGPTAFSSQYVEILTQDLEMFSNNGNQCTQIIRWDHVTKETEPDVIRVSIGEINKSILLELANDDVGWRFILSRSDVTTEKRARELRVHNPNSPFKAEAYASVYFLTGECVVDQKP